MKRHHKIILGGFGTVILIFMIVTGILLNGLIVKQEINHRDLSNKITGLQTDTQTKFNEITESIIKTEKNIENLNSEIDIIDEKFETLKDSTSSDFSGIIENAVKSVVTIKTDVGQGTGFLITTDGYIVTNAHVLAGARKVYIMNYQQEILETVFIGYEGIYDIALLKVDGNFENLELEDSENIQIGEKVIAIGNPLGLQFSVSEGIISGIDRIGINGIEAYIQTDAALNPGNSGGPLINKQGKVVGINNFKISGGESLGFALESNYLKETINSISNKELSKSLIE